LGHLGRHRVSALGLPRPLQVSSWHGPCGPSAGRGNPAREEPFRHPSSPYGPPEKPLGWRFLPSGGLGKRVRGRRRTLFPQPAPPGPTPSSLRSHSPGRGSFYAFPSSLMPDFPASLGPQASHPCPAGRRDGQSEMRALNRTAGGHWAGVPGGPSQRRPREGGRFCTPQPQEQSWAWRSLGFCSPLRPTRNPTGQEGGSGCLG
jgi:hypothetical protein